MQFVRKIINSKMLENIVDIPVELKNKKIEMLLLPIDSTDDCQKSFDPRKFRGAVRLDKKLVQKQIQDLRDEWDRVE